MNPKPYLGYRFEKEISNLKTEEEKSLRKRCIHFLIELQKQFQQRLPKNIKIILEKMSILSVSNTLKIDKVNLIPLLELMKVDDVIDKINNQWVNITINRYRLARNK